MVRKSYTPDRGDIIYISFNPGLGHEQRGRRPALVLSSFKYNSDSGLAIACPITSTIRNNPFIVVLDTPKAKGAILSDQVKSISWQARKAQYVSKAPTEIVKEVIHRINLLIN